MSVSRSNSRSVRSFVVGSIWTSPGHDVAQIVPSSACARPPAQNTSSILACSSPVRGSRRKSASACCTQMESSAARMPDIPMTSSGYCARSRSTMIRSLGMSIATTRGSCCAATHSREPSTVALPGNGTGIRSTISWVAGSIARNTELSLSRTQKRPSAKNEVPPKGRSTWLTWSPVAASRNARPGSTESPSPTRHHGARAAAPRRPRRRTGRPRYRPGSDGRPARDPRRGASDARTHPARCRMRRRPRRARGGRSPSASTSVRPRRRGRRPSRRGG